MGACWGPQAWSGVLLLHLGLCGSLWSGVDLVGLSSGAQTKPVQDYPSQDKVCDYHEKTASSSLIAKNCHACWRGGLPLISCREMLNTGTHSPLYTHTETHRHTRTHIVTCMLILIHMCKYSHMQFVAHAHIDTTIKFIFIIFDNHTLSSMWNCSQRKLYLFITKTKVWSTLWPNQTFLYKSKHAKAKMFHLKL